jgi:hypothetical protein
MEESTTYKITKEIKMSSGEIVNISVGLVNIQEKNYNTAKDFLDTMFKEIKELF